MRAAVAAAGALALLAFTFGWPALILGYHLWRGQ